MTTKDIVTDLIYTVTKEAKNEKCCLNCSYSFFSRLQESGLCHNYNQVKGHTYPKVISEFSKCGNWEIKKIVRKK